MGITKQTIYTCDRCGHTTTNKGEVINNEMGEATLKAKVILGAVTCGGSGGASWNYDYWLCLSCAKELKAFLENRT